MGILGDLMLVRASPQEIDLLKGITFSNRFIVLCCGHFPINWLNVMSTRYIVVKMPSYTVSTF